MSKFYKNVLSKFQWSSPSEYNVLILGLDNAGKSSLVERLSSDSEESLKYVSPTVGLTEKHITIENNKVCLHDVSGQWRTRQLWHTLFHEANAVIYVVDSTDTSRLGEARCELCDVLLDERMSKVPLLVLANKQDLRSALPCSTLVDLMGLNRIRDRDWKIADCSVTSKRGIFKSTVWINDNLRKQMPQSSLSKIFSKSFFLGPTCFLNCRRAVVDNS